MLQGVSRKRDAIQSLGDSSTIFNEWPWAFGQLFREMVDPSFETPCVLWGLLLQCAKRGVHEHYRISVLRALCRRRTGAFLSLIPSANSQLDPCCKLPSTGAVKKLRNVNFFGLWKRLFSLLLFDLFFALMMHIRKWSSTFQSVKQ